MNLTLRHDISFCEAAGHYVFLDLASGRYFALPPPAEMAFRRLVRSEDLDPGERRLLAPLIESGVLLPSSGRSAPIPHPSPPEAQSTLFDHSPPVRSGLVIEALLRLNAAALSVRLRPLRAILTAIGRRKAAIAPDAKPDCVMVTAAAFRRASLLFSPLDRCLPRSIALAHALLDRGCRPDLVIAVRLQPFRAHCWVQDGPMLVNESLDEARGFTPILVV